MEESFIFANREGSLTEETGQHIANDEYDWSVLKRLLRTSSESYGQHFLSPLTWKLLAVQGVIFSALAIAGLCWFLCWKKRSNNNNLTVKEAFKKISHKNDFLSNEGHIKSIQNQPVSLSKKMSIKNFFNPSEPPPSADLDYLDLEAGHRRLSRLSFQSNDSFSGRISRISVASCSSCSSISRKQSSESSSSYSVSSSRNSRVSFHSFQEVPDQVTVDNIKKEKNLELSSTKKTDMIDHLFPTINSVNEQ